MSPHGRRGTGRAAVAAGLLATSLALGVTTAESASAATPSTTDGQTYQVCADHLALRTTPEPTGPDQGEILNGWSVLVYSHAGNGMLYVHAYGQLNRNGYVDDGHFC